MWGWVKKLSLWSHTKDKKSPDRQSVALQTTLNDLRHVASELQATNAELSSRVERIKESSRE